MRYALAVLTSAVLSSCGGRSPTPVPAPSPTPTATVQLAGRVTALNGGQTIVGATVSLAGVTSTTDGAGSYTLTVPSGPMDMLTVTGAGLVPRSVPMARRDGRVDLDAFGPGFDLAFYRQFARDGFDNPGALQPIRHWTQAPKIYLRTVDEAGIRLDFSTLDAARDALLNTAGIWSGGVFGVAALERGTETREGVPGWITVKWPNPRVAGECGRAQVGVDGGWIQLNFLGSCACRSIASGIAPRVVRHALGHAFGYYHTDSINDVMYGPTVNSCDLVPSVREQEYAKYVYRRPVGNTDPDSDPLSSAVTSSVRRFRD